MTAERDALAAALDKTDHEAWSIHDVEILIGFLHRAGKQITDIHRPETDVAAAMAAALDNVDREYERGWTPSHYARVILDALATAGWRLVNDAEPASGSEGGEAADREVSGRLMEATDSRPPLPASADEATALLRALVEAMEKQRPRRFANPYCDWSSAEHDAVAAVRAYLARVDGDDDE